MKSLNLSFTDIAKRVGEKWQVLLTEEKEPYETQATSAKERFHTEMAAYKMTDTFVEYSDYLTDFKTKNALQAGRYLIVGRQIHVTRRMLKIVPDGKRPRLEQELSNASSTSVGSGTNNADSTLINADARHRGRVDSMSSTGQYSTPGSLPSPASVNSRPAAPRGSVGAILPNGAASPMSTSPSSPSVYRDSSAGPLFSHAQPSIEYPERLTAYNSLQQLPRILPSKSHEHQNSSSSTTPIDPRLSHSRTSPYSSSHHAPSLVHHTSSHSSNPSVNSNQSGTSTAASSNPSLNSNQSSVSNAASSLFKQGGDEDSKPQMTLPPLAAVSMKSSGTSSPAEHALRPSRASQSGLTSSGLVAQQNSDSPFGSFAPSGMEFESLQLSLPYNISFGRQPLPRPDNDGKLANICDLQDVSRERHSLRGLSLQQTGTSPRETLGSSRSPSDRPVLPSISQVSCIARHGTPDPNEQPKPDPLSVLADAANDADRKSRPSRPST